MRNKNNSKKFITKNLIAKQSNVLLDSKCKITLPGSYDLLFRLIAEIDDDAIEFGNFVFTVKDLENMLGKRIRTEQIENIGRELSSCRIEIKKPNGDFSIGSWFSFFDFYIETNTIELSFHSKLKPYLLQLKSNYTKYNIKYIIDLNSEFSKKLYIVLKSKEYYTHDYKIKIEDLHLQLFGEERDIEFKELNRMIKKYIVEINKKTDILVEYKTHKTYAEFNRAKTTHVSFSISGNTKPSTALAITLETKATPDNKTIYDCIGERFYLIDSDKYATLHEVKDGNSASSKKIAFSFDNENGQIIREYPLSQLNTFFNLN